MRKIGVRALRLLQAENVRPLLGEKARVTRPIRSRTELMFQVATVSGIEGSGGLCRGGGWRSPVRRGSRHSRSGRRRLYT